MEILGWLCIVAITLYFAAATAFSFYAQIVIAGKLDWSHGILLIALAALIWADCHFAPFVIISK